MATQGATIEKLPMYIPAGRSEVIQVGILGAAVGIITALLAELISRYFIEPVFCRSTDSFAVCANGGMVAFYAATVITAVVAVAVLANLGAFRPLLIGLAAAISMWGIKAYFAGLAWWEYGIWMAVLFGLSYLLFFWLLRARSFVIALILTVVAVACIRLILTLG